MKAALLDFDGTLVDLPVDWDRLRDQVARMLASYGISGELRPLYPSIAQAFLAMRERGIQPGVRARLRRQINRRLTEVEMEALANAEPLPGSRELLAALRAAGWTVVIQTSNSVRVVDEAWRQFSFPPVHQVVGRESARIAKPHPLGVRRALRDLGLSAGECVVVGDGDYDIQLGRAIGARTIRVRSGHQLPARLAADVEVDSLHQVIPLLIGDKELAEVRG